MPQNIGERGLIKYECHSIAVRRGDLTLKGRLRFRNPEGHTEPAEGKDKFVVVPHGYANPWKQIKSSLGIRNRTHGTLDVTLSNEDIVVLPTDSGNRPYKVSLD